MEIEMIIKLEDKQMELLLKSLKSIDTKTEYWTKRQKRMEKRLKELEEKWKSC